CGLPGCRCLTTACGDTPMPNTPAPGGSPLTGSLASGLHPRELAALAHLDQARRWAQGERPLVEAYLERYPALRTDPEALLDLVCNEISLRQQHGDSPTPEEYLARFPDLTAPLRRRFRLLEAVRDRSLLDGLPSGHSQAAALPPPGLLRCPVCSLEVPEDSRFCSRCGAALPDCAPKPTTADRGRPPSPWPPPPARSGDQARFTPGQLLGGRYRIVAVLGKGGMGEVYRADDLRLGQSVALKFLPATLAHEPDRLARLHQEVRVARQVSHPHVCRVYDIAEADGQPFLTMEYVDGENLASLLRRIGRLPEDKGVELARQLCLGLAAAHETGVIHRDLKPHPPTL